MCKNIFVADLLRSQFLFELLQTSLTVKNSENGMVGGGGGVDAWKNVSDGQRQFFFRNEGRI